MDELDNAFIVNHRTDVNMFMRYMQYRILHYGIATMRELVKMNITHDDKCSFCGEVETFEHLEYKCIKADSFWVYIQTLIKSLSFDNYILDAKTIMLEELRRRYKLLNIIILAIEMGIHVYSNRNKTSRLILEQVKPVLKDLFHTEKYYAKTNNK